MPINNSELVWRPAASVSDATPANNGGRMATGTIVSGVKNNLFPDVPQSERAAGSTKYRKAFIHVASADNIALQSPKVFLDALTPADDYVTFYAGSQTDTQAAISGTRPYGVGRPTAALSAAQTSFSVNCEHSSYQTTQPFRVGDKIRVADIPATGGAGNEEIVEIATVGYSGAVANITTTTGLQFAYATAANTLVSTVYEPANIIASVGSPSVTSALGTLNGALMEPRNLGGVFQNWTITFTSTTAFRLDGDTLGTSVATGDTSTTFSPNNPARSSPYFSIPAAAWGGTWAPGDTVTFQTVPAAVPVWYRRDVPASSGTLSNDAAVLAIQGESA